MEVVDRLIAKFPGLPTTVGGFWSWVVGISAAHVIVSFFTRAFLGQGPFSDASLASLWPRVGTGITFGLSLMLLLGFAYPDLLNLLGDVRPFLAIAGLVGTIYGVLSLGRKD